MKGWLSACSLFLSLYIIYPLRIFLLLSLSEVAMVFLSRSHNDGSSRTGLTEKGI